MENAMNFLGGMSVQFTRKTGVCATHGENETLVRGDAAWHCSKCFEAEMSAVENSKWLAERNSTLYRIAQIPKKYIGQKFTAHTDAQKSVRTIAKTFRDFIVNEKRWATLVLMGTVGTGKTLLACEFGESFIRNLSKSVRYVTAKGMISEIQATYSSKEGATEESAIQEFISYDLLIIDEIDAKPDRENANLLLTEIINRRYNEEKPVIVITNQPFDNLAKFVGDRVHDRLHENAFICSFDWKSFRRDNVDQIKKAA